ncbi:MAG: dihydrolipoyl dehydrogenase [Candidatus Eisenbacteria bacterium]
MAQSYDLIVIGSGPGGYVATVRAAQLGLSTAIVEKQKALGGTCLHWGCIPTKVLLYAAEMRENLDHMKQYGIEVEGFSVDWKKLLRRKKIVVDKNAKGVEYLMKKGKVDVLQGTGFIEAPGKVRVTPEEGDAVILETKNILVATGSQVASIPGADFDGDKIISSDDALYLEEVPKSMVVLGGGAVGVEFASLYHSFGCEITLVEMLPGLVPLMDAEVSKELARAFQKRGIAVKVGTKFVSVDKTGDGVKVVLENVESGGKETIAAGKLLVAVGRRPVTDGIGLDEAGVKRERGFIPTGPRMETNVPGIYAIGDVVPTAALAHLASEEGVVAVEGIAGRDPQPIDHDQVPSCVYCIPEIAAVGLTEEEARRRGHDAKVGKFPFSANSKAAVVGDTVGFVKIVSDAKHGEILGVHMIGHHVTELLSGVTAVMHAEGGVHELGETIHPHPTLSEAIHEAALAAGEGAIHI